MPVSYRPMREEDLRPAFDLQVRSFVDLDRRRGVEDAGPLPDPEIALVRFRPLLETDPPARGEGAGRGLLSRAWAYGNGARGHVILSSSDPRAIRAYALL